MESRERERARSAWQGADSGAEARGAGRGVIRGIFPIEKVTQPLKTNKTPSWEIHKVEKFTYLHHICRTEVKDRSAKGRVRFFGAVYAHSSTKGSSQRIHFTVLCSCV